jgi:hypothetical protein
MTLKIRIGRRDLVGAAVVFAVLVVAVVVVVAPRPAPGTARYVASHIKDPPDSCHSPDFSPLWNPDLSAWRTRAEKSSNFACGDAGPVVQWARFRSPADLEAALHATSGAPAYVCRTDVELVRFVGFPRSSEDASCAALHGRRT